MLGSPRKALALIAVPIFALVLTLTASVTPASAASTKVVIVVGPVGGTTASYISEANASAAAFRKYTSNVTTIYSPHATWSAVRSALQGANVVLYLGHGNGFPSPYSSTLNRYSMNGFGLNATDNAGNSNVAYYGEYYIASQVRLAPNAVVLFSRLCYASGNNEWGAGIPSLSTAEKRVDNFAAGFFAAGARSVIADGLGDMTWYINALFTRHTTMGALFRAAPNARNHYVSFGSVRSPGYTATLDVGTYSWVPDRDPYYRSMVANNSLATDAAIGMTGTTTSRLTGKTTYSSVNVRSGAGAGYAAVTTLAQGATFSVTGAIRRDSTGRTWAPVRTASGKTGWIATSFASFSGSASALAALNVRWSASTGSTVTYVIPQGARFTVRGSFVDPLKRTWFSISYGSATGWVASWYTAP